MRVAKNGNVSQARKAEEQKRVVVVLDGGVPPVLSLAVHACDDECAMSHEQNMRQAGIHVVLDCNQRSADHQCMHPCHVNVSGRYWTLSQ